ncbi:hypothetical protein D3C81_1229490 [compost metagenome]
MEPPRPRQNCSILPEQTETGAAQFLKAWEVLQTGPKFARLIQAIVYGQRPMRARVARAKYMLCSGWEQEQIVFRDAYDLIVDKVKPFSIVHEHDLHKSMAVHLQIKCLLGPVKVKGQRICKKGSPVQYPLPSV